MEYRSLTHAAYENLRVAFVKEFEIITVDFDPEVSRSGA
jgi:hypothetical protein